MNIEEWMGRRVQVSIFPPDRRDTGTVIEIIDGAVPKARVAWERCMVYGLHPIKVLVVVEDCNKPSLED